MDRIKRLSTEILSEYKDSFGTDFSENKKMLNEITIVRSKGLKNKIAGYITKILLREHKFQVRKQKLIDDEKKSKVYKKVLETFQDAELININIIEDKKDE